VTPLVWVLVGLAAGVVLGRGAQLLAEWVRLGRDAGGDAGGAFVRLHAPPERDAAGSRDGAPDRKRA
jgi:hypothetical protein